MAGLAAAAVAGPPRVPVYSNLDAAPHPDDPGAIARRLGEHLASPGPVRGDDRGDARRRASGSSSSAGPARRSPALVGSILGDRPHLAVSIDAPGRPGLGTLLTALGRLVAAGVAVRGLARLTARRGARRLDLDRLPTGRGRRPPPSTWLVNGSRARPIAGPEPRRLGMAAGLIGESAVDPDDRGTEEHGRGPDRHGEAARPSTVTAERTSAEPPPDRTAIRPPDSVAGPRATGGTERRRSPADRRSQRGGCPRPQRPRPAAARDESAGGAALTPGDGNECRTGHARTSGHDAGVPRPPARHDARLPLRTDAGGPAGRPDRCRVRASDAGRIDPPARRPAADPHRGRATIRPSPMSNGDRPAPATSDDGPRHRATTGAAAPTRAEARPGGRDPEARRPADAARRADPATMADAVAVADAVRAEPAGPAATVADRLVAIVRDRTGYPAEMLGMGLDLEADLGIDSIKRVEILGSLRDAVDGLADRAGSGLMDGLARARTLGEIVARVEEAIADGEAGPRPAAAPAPDRRPASGGPPASGHSLRRMVLEPVEAGPVAGRSGLAAGGTVIVTDDGRGVATRLAERLEGGRASGRPGGSRLGRTRRRSRRRLEGLRREATARRDHPRRGRSATTRGPGSTPRAGPTGSGRRSVASSCWRGPPPTTWSGRPRRGGSCLIAATAMGGAFASAGPAGRDFFPGHGGDRRAGQDAGPRVARRPVPGRRPRPRRAGRSARRAARWTRRGRTTAGPRSATGTAAASGCGPSSGRSDRPGPPWRSARASRSSSPAAPAGSPRPSPRRWRGDGGRPSCSSARAPPPSDREDPATAVAEDAAALKAALLERARREGRSPGPAELERAYRGVLRDREIRGSIRRMREAGARVEYARADVRDGAALAAALDAWRARHGEPVGLIHGAGVIHDKLLRDKTPESFDRVLSTKLDGALNLARLLRRRAAAVRGLLLVGRRPVRQPGAVGLRGGERRLEQAGALARPPLAGAGRRRSTGGRGRASGWSRTWRATSAAAGSA